MSHSATATANSPQAAPDLFPMFGRHPLIQEEAFRRENLSTWQDWMSEAICAQALLSELSIWILTALAVHPCRR
jgi:hypothetical protein